MKRVEAAFWRSGRALGDLGLFDIGDGCGSGGDLGTGEGAEAIQRADAEIAGNAALGAGAIKEDARLRHDDAAEHVEGGLQFFVVEERIGHDEFARLDAQDIG